MKCSNTWWFVWMFWRFWTCLKVHDDLRNNMCFYMLLLWLLLVWKCVICFWFVLLPFQQQLKHRPFLAPQEGFRRDLLYEFYELLCLFTICVTEFDGICTNCKKIYGSAWFCLRILTVCTNVKELYWFVLICLFVCLFACVFVYLFVFVFGGNFWSLGAKILFSRKPITQIVILLWFWGSEGSFFEAWGVIFEARGSSGAPFLRTWRLRGAKIG